MHNEDRHPGLSERGDALHGADAPGGDDRRFSTWWLAAALVVVALGAIAIADSRDGGLTDSAENPSSTNEGAPTSVSPVAGTDNGDCDPLAVADSLSQGLPTFDFDATESVADLVSRSPIIVRGQLIEATAASGGTRILVKTGLQIEPEREPETARSRVVNLWTPATVAPTDLLFVDFVAFLTGEQVTVGNGGDPAWATHLEGLWIACGNDSPAVSVLFAPIGEGWNAINEGGVTLDDLWLLARFPNGQITEPLGSPSHSSDGADVFDLRLINGERFRLSLPEGLGRDLATPPSRRSRSTRWSRCGRLTPGAPGAICRPASTPCICRIRPVRS